ncbi:hypothetical protein GGR92_003389 [Spirosoma lacussanchae]|uniref:hypothetical protein n=1 Tax=Spirosoma lacussanchae TaxID=1884249 RepID=UPI0011095C7C|nr:hypothetical protein [Spirosoma lacussanchae]
MKSTLSVALLCLLMACADKKPGSQEAAETQIVGNDADPNGCKGSAGYTWSAVKNRCIRVFEEGTPFKNYEATAPGEAEIATYVVLSNDQSKAEIFFGGTDKPAVLEKRPVVEGEIRPVLFESEGEQLKICYYKDAYLILFQDSVRFTQDYSLKNGLASMLETTK